MKSKEKLTLDFFVVADPRSSYVLVHTCSCLEVALPDDVLFRCMMMYRVLK